MPCASEELPGQEDRHRKEDHHDVLETRDNQNRRRNFGDLSRQRPHQVRLRRGPFESARADSASVRR